LPLLSVDLGMLDTQRSQSRCPNGSPTSCHSGSPPRASGQSSEPSPQRQSDRADAPAAGRHRCRPMPQSPPIEVLFPLPSSPATPLQDPKKGKQRNQEIGKKERNEKGGKRDPEQRPDPSTAPLEPPARRPWLTHLGLPAGHMGQGEGDGQQRRGRQENPLLVSREAHKEGNVRCESGHSRPKSQPYQGGRQGSADKGDPSHQRRCKRCDSLLPLAHCLSPRMPSGAARNPVRWITLGPSLSWGGGITPSIRRGLPTWFSMSSPPVPALGSTIRS